MNKTTPWVEKYRPTNFDDIVLDNMNKKIFTNILNNRYFPNLLFYGPPGTGKTTTIINLINEFQTKYYKIDKSLIIHLNASDERGIDIVRNQISTFVKSNNLFEVGIKFVILDEVDSMTKNAQYALKYLLQTCGNNVKFCLICNYISKVDDSLQNEFICIRFNQLPRDNIYNFIYNISLKEKIILDKITIDAIQDIYKSDIRSIINFIQLNQHLDLNDWKNGVLNNEIFEEIHKYILEINENSNKTLKTYIHEISIQYNIDKKSLIQKYLNYIIRDETKSQYITSNFLILVKNLIHGYDIKNTEIVDYFCDYIAKNMK
jgi:DNA polymerase III delta prime subunit